MDSSIFSVQNVGLHQQSTNAYFHYPFGMIMPGRKFVVDGYRFGYNGQEKTDEINSGDGNHYTAKFWEYDTRTARRWNIDPMFRSYPNWSPYAINFDNPIWFQDPLGAQGEEDDKEEVKPSDLPTPPSIGEFFAGAVDKLDNDQEIGIEGLKEIISAVILRSSVENIAGVDEEGNETGFGLQSLRTLRDDLFEKLDISKSGETVDLSLGTKEGAAKSTDFKIGELGFGSVKLKGVTAGTKVVISKLAKDEVEITVVGAKLTVLGADVSAIIIKGGEAEIQFTSVWVPNISVELSNEAFPYTNTSTK